LTPLKSELIKRLDRYPLTETRCIIAGAEWRITEVKDHSALLAATKTDEDLQNFPYGLSLWASAVGLAKRLARQPDSVRGKRVLEIGAGVGLAGLVAPSLGALVTQTDYQVDALTLCQHNATINGICDIQVRPGDWREFPADLLGAFDLVIGSDVLYERSLHLTLSALLPKLLAPQGRILLADPLRPQAFDFMALREVEGWLIAMEAVTVPWDGILKEIGLFSLIPPDSSTS